MQFRISSDKFMRGVQVVQNVAQPSLTTPILENMLLKAEEGGRITLRTSNLTLNAVSILEGVVTEPGEVAIPMKELGLVSKELPMAELEIDVQDNLIRMNCGPASLRLRGVDPSEYPPMLELEEGQGVKMKANELVSMIDKTLFASSEEKARYILEGIKVDVEGSRVKFVATDGKRLSLVEKTIEQEVENTISVLVPGKTMNEVRRIIDSAKEVEIRTGEKKIEFLGEDFLLSSNLLVDNFPPYRQLIPSELNINFGLQRSAFHTAVRRASVLVDERTKMILLEVTADGVLVKGSSYAHGEASTSIEVEYEGEPFELAYRSDYLMEVLRVIQGDKVRFEMKSPKSPALMKDSGDPGFLHLIMPIKLDEIKKADEEEENEQESDI